MFGPRYAKAKQGSCSACRTLYLRAACTDAAAASEGAFRARRTWQRVGCGSSARRRAMACATSAPPFLGVAHGQQRSELVCARRCQFVPDDAASVRHAEQGDSGNSIQPLRCAVACKLPARARSSASRLGTSAGKSSLPADVISRQTMRQVFGMPNTSWCRRG